MYWLKREESEANGKGKFRKVPVRSASIKACHIDTVLLKREKFIVGTCMVGVIILLCFFGEQCGV